LSLTKDAGKHIKGDKHKNVYITNTKKGYMQNRLHN
jgi:hypothetical protein